MRTIRHFLRVAKEDRDHTDEHVDCLCCAKAMAIFWLVGGRYRDVVESYWQGARHGFHGCGIRQGGDWN